MCEKKIFKTSLFEKTKVRLLKKKLRQKQKALKGKKKKCLYADGILKYRSMQWS